MSNAPSLLRTACTKMVRGAHAGASGCDPLSDSAAPLGPAGDSTAHAYERTLATARLMGRKRELRFLDHGP
jgi:hypothetical protein